MDVMGAFLFALVSGWTAARWMFTKGASLPPVICAAILAIATFWVTSFSKQLAAGALGLALGGALLFAFEHSIRRTIQMRLRPFSMGGHET